MKPTTKGGIALFILLCIALSIAAGCLGTAGNTVTAGSLRAASPPGIPSAGWAASKAVPAEDTAFPVPLPTAVPTTAGQGGSVTETKIIRTADLTLEVTNVSGAVDAIQGIAIAQGGYLSSTNLQRDYNNRLTGTAILRVPATGFSSALETVRGLGTVKAVSTGGQDVTEEYVDLAAQKASYQNQLAQYNAIMKQSTRVEDIIKVQEQIDQVQTELDRLTGRLNYLDNRIDLATITVYLQEPEPVGGQTGHDFVAAINAGIGGFFGMIDGLIILLLSLLPLLIIGGAAYGIYRWRKGRAVKGSPEEKKS